MKGIIFANRVNISTVMYEMKNIKASVEGCCWKKMNTNHLFVKHLLARALSSRRTSMFYGWIIWSAFLVQIIDYIQNRCWFARNEFEVHLVILEFRSHPWMEKLIKMVSNWIQETLHRLKHNQRKCCKMSRIKMFESCHEKHHFRSNFKSLDWTLVIMAYNIVMRYLVSFWICNWSINEFP